MATTKQHDENWSKNKLKKLLADNGVFSVPIAANGMGVSGISDRLGVKDGVFIAIEVKRPGRRGEANRGASALQVKFLYQVSEHGGIGFVFDGEDDDVEKLLDVIAYPQKCMGYNNLELDYWKKK